MKLKRQLFLFLAAVLLVLTGCESLDDLLGYIDSAGQYLEGESQLDETNTGTTHQTTFSDDHAFHMEQLAQLENENDDDYMHLDFMTIDINDWNGEHVYYGGKDHLGRTLPAEAHLSELNLGKSEGRERQTYNPSGWQQNQLEVDGSSVWVKNRGHLIAYTLTFNLNDEGYFEEGHPGSENNPDNLFTQTQHANQRIMTRFEDAVRDVLREGSNVIFKASPVFRGDELMARGIWLQAVSDCGELEFSVYIYNRQPGVEFDYATGENNVIVD